MMLGFLGCTHCAPVTCSAMRVAWCVNSVVCAQSPSVPPSHSNAYCTVHRGLPQRAWFATAVQCYIVLMYLLWCLWGRAWIWSGIVCCLRMGCHMMALWSCDLHGCCLSESHIIESLHVLRECLCGVFIRRFGASVHDLYSIDNSIGAEKQSCFVAGTSQSFILDIYWNPFNASRTFWTTKLISLLAAESLDKWSRSRTHNCSIVAVRIANWYLKPDICSETAIKQSENVSELFQANLHIYRHAWKYANPNTVSCKFL